MYIKNKAFFSFKLKLPNAIKLVLFIGEYIYGKFTLSLCVSTVTHYTFIMHNGNETVSVIPYIIDFLSIFHV